MQHKIALLSDIHGNLAALEAVLQDMSTTHVQQILVLGDLAFRGPEPNASVARIRSLSCPVIGGNADDWVVRGIRSHEVPPHVLERMQAEREFTVTHMEKSHLDYLASLPSTFQYAITNEIQLFICHATPLDRFQVVLPDSDVSTLQQIYPLSRTDPMMVAYGHIHLPFIRYIEGSIILNPGSVGLPFDGIPKASYAILECDGGNIHATIRRVAYDPTRTLEALADLDYPHREPLSQMIKTGYPA